LRISRSELTPGRKKKSNRRSGRLVGFYGPQADSAPRSTSRGPAKPIRGFKPGDRWKGFLLDSVGGFSAWGAARRLTVWEGGADFQTPCGRGERKPIGPGADPITPARKPCKPFGEGAWSELANEYPFSGRDRLENRIGQVRPKQATSGQQGLPPLLVNRPRKGGR